MSLNHLHILATARRLGAPPATAAEVETWMTELVSLVGMEVLIPAKAIRSDQIGNEGVTGIICLTTSHASLHCWDRVEEPFLTMDLYSCRDFDPEIVLKHLGAFQPGEIEFVLIDRATGYRIIEKTIRPI